MPGSRRAVAPSPSGYSGTPLASKLGIGPGCRLHPRHAPGNYSALVAPLPEGVRRVRRIDAATDIIHLFATRRAELARANRPKRSPGRAPRPTPRRAPPVSARSP
jgi:hypothetical protein